MAPKWEFILSVVQLLQLHAVLCYPPQETPGPAAALLQQTPALPWQLR